MAIEKSPYEVDPPLPLYLSRHMRLGFDSDDVAALISSIDSSQDLRTSTPPHLPAEILFQILEFVPVDHILTWRLVCRGFRDAIDGPVQYAHLRRAELIGYLGPRAQYPLNQLSESRYEQINLVRAHFERIDDSPTTEAPEARAPAKWHYDLAIFTIDDRWFNEFARIEDKTTQDGVRRPAWQSLLDDLQLLGEEEPYGTLKWCLRLDKAVLGLDFSPEALRRCIMIDLVNKRMMVQWKDLLFNFLQTETRLRVLTEEKCDSSFTYSLQEDCLRAVRRQRFRATLDLNNKDHRLINWEMNMLRPLFGRPRYDKASSDFVGLEGVEDDATKILSMLRKEASMSREETAYLKQLSKDRSRMERDLDVMNTTFGDWRSKLFGVSAGLTGSSSLARVPRNPAAWNDELRAQEEKRIRAWQSQRRVIEQLALMLNGSMEAMSLPEDAFDDCESDI